jgi:DMSO/TMAO reductase YedYZ molybdopterin-dependent catalytic subunit
MGGFMLAVLVAGPAAAQHADPVADAAAPPPATIDIPLDAPAREGLARTQVKASAHGQALDCTGVALVDLLRHAGAIPDAPLRGGAQLGRRVEVLARDGYRVTFSLGELDPEFGNRQVFLVDRCDGRPLPDETGPLRLVVPEDSRPARWIRQIQRISVLSP